VKAELQLIQNYAEHQGFWDKLHSLSDPTRYHFVKLGDNDPFSKDMYTPYMLYVGGNAWQSYWGVLIGSPHFPHAYLVREQLGSTPTRVVFQNCEFMVPFMRPFQAISENKGGLSSVCAFIAYVFLLAGKTTLSTFLHYPATRLNLKKAFQDADGNFVDFDSNIIPSFFPSVRRPADIHSRSFSRDTDGKQTHNRLGEEDTPTRYLFTTYTAHQGHGRNT
jgi:hypothetical protein